MTDQPKNGFWHCSKSSTEHVAVYSRFGKYNGQPYQETAVFVRAGTNGSSLEDPRIVTLPHDEHKGKWLLSYSENMLGKPELLNSGYHPLALPLSDKAELLTEEEYVAAKGRVISSAELTTQSMMRVTALHQENKDKKAIILRALGLTADEIDIMLS